LESGSEKIKTKTILQLLSHLRQQSPFKNGVSQIIQQNATAITGLRGGFRVNTPAPPGKVIDWQPTERL
jgi:hypothetical protein